MATATMAREDLTYDEKTGIMLGNPDGGGESNDDETFLPLDIRLDPEKLRTLAHLIVDWKVDNGCIQHIANLVGQALHSGDVTLDLARLAAPDEE